VPDCATWRAPDDARTSCWFSAQQVSGNLVSSTEDEDAVDQLNEECPMSEQTEGQREPDDAMARQSGAVSEDAQPLTTDEDADTTAHGAPGGTAGAERTDVGDGRGPREPRA